jgi:hypothetical protein
MPSASARPDLKTLLDAYALVGVQYSTSPLEIRSAFKHRVREHHPDKFQAGSSAQQQATQKMAALNAAYHLIRDAPLRYHRISTGTRPEDPWTDDELDAALRRSRTDLAVSRALPVALSALGIIIYVLLIGWPTGWGVAGPFIGLAVIWMAYFMAAQTSLGLQIWRVIDIFKFGHFVLRQLGVLR